MEEVYNTKNLPNVKSVEFEPPEGIETLHAIYDYGFGTWTAFFTYETPPPSKQLKVIYLSWLDDKVISVDMTCVVLDYMNRQPIHRLVRMDFADEREFLERIGNLTEDDFTKFKDHAVFVKNAIDAMKRKMGDFETKKGN